MKTLRNSFLFLLLIFTSAGKSQSQITINELTNLSSRITKMYDDDRLQIDNIVKEYVPKGYILTTFSDSLLVSLNNTHVKKKVIHVLENIENTGSEKIIIWTLRDTFEGTLKTVAITFYTSEISLYKTWYSNLSTNPASYTPRDNFHNSYNFTYQGNKSINLGVVAKNNVTTYTEMHNGANYGGSAQNLVADRDKMLYYVTISYNPL